MKQSCIAHPTPNRSAARTRPVSSSSWTSRFRWKSRWAIRRTASATSWWRRSTVGFRTWQSAPAATRASRTGWTSASSVIAPTSRRTRSSSPRCKGRWRAGRWFRSPKSALGRRGSIRRMQYLPDEETGEIFQVPCEMPVWVDPRAEGGTPMCHMLYYAHQLLNEWIMRHPRSFPPIVVHISDGESQDGNPIPYADALKSLATEDGNVLFFNCHLSMTAADPFMFPASDLGLPDELARACSTCPACCPNRFSGTGRQKVFPCRPTPAVWRSMPIWFV